MPNDAQRSLAEAVLAAARQRHLKIATAESCTGGLVSAALTDIAGSSDVFERGFVTYSNEAKMQLLGVQASTIAEHGAVSEQTARAMAEGALKNSLADIAVSVTGVAGPGGGTPQKPVGLVHFAIAIKDKPTQADHHHFGDVGRTSIRSQSVDIALRLLLSAASN